MTKARVVQFRRSLKHVHERHFILDAGAEKRKEAEKFVGKTVVWTSSAGKKIEGKISSAHGNKGKIRAIFERGLPGQSLNDEVEIK